MVRTRFAPSPTGDLHIGSLRTALFSYALAKSQSGKFILRIEDTDKKREKEGSIDKIIKLLHYFGIEYDEGPDKMGNYGPYVQSQRLSIYKEKAEELVQKGWAYYCFCSQERLEKLKKDQISAKIQPMYDGKCREIPIEEARQRIKNGEKFVIRLKVPKNRKIVFHDELRGDVTWDSNTVDDQVLLKSDGFPTYHLGVVVDDILMKITHITRGSEWIPSVPKHVLLFEAFEYKMPIIAHLPLILDPEGGKLSKRKGSVATIDFLRKGYLKEALLNFIMFLGWSPKTDQEIFSLDEFVKNFSIKKINQSAGVFDRVKLNWFNGIYIRKLSLEEFEKRFIEWLKNYFEDEEFKEKLLSDTELKRKLALIQERIVTLSDCPKMLEFFYKKLKIPDLHEIKGVKRYEKGICKEALKKYVLIFQGYSKFPAHEMWEKDIRATADEFKIKHSDMFMLLRIAICRSEFSPPLYEVMQIFGLSQSVKKIKELIACL